MIRTRQVMIGQVSSVVVLIGMVVFAFLFSVNNSNLATVQNTLGTNLISNPDFSQGFSGWGGYSGWTGTNGYATLDYSTYHNGAPSLRLDTDIHGISSNDPACWIDPRISLSQPYTTYVFSVWVKTGSNPDHSYDQTQPYGARMMVDFYDSVGVDLTNQGYYQIINSTVPIVTGCPVVSWNSAGWTLIQIYVKCTSPTNDPPTQAVPWLQTFPAQTDGPYSCWFDDAYFAVATSSSTPTLAGSWFINGVQITDSSQTVYSKTLLIAFEFDKTAGAADSAVTCTVTEGSNLLVTLTNSAAGKWTGTVTFTGGSHDLSLQATDGKSTITLSVVGQLW